MNSRFALLLLAAVSSGCIRFSVEDKPFGAGLKFTGNQVFSEAALRKIAIDAGCNDLITCEVFLETAYTEQGYVIANLVEADDGSFTVEEGPRFNYGKIEVVEAGPGAQPTPLMTAAELSLETGAIVKRSEIKAAIDKLQGKYTAAGFPAANIIPMTEVDRDTKTLGIKIEISRSGAIP
jgi:outer membrane protein assembly factor BamA